MSNWTDDQARRYNGNPPPSTSDIQRQHQISTNEAEAIRRRAEEERQRQNK